MLRRWKGNAVSDPVTGNQPEEDQEQPPAPLYDAWVVIANARDWHLDDAQARQWVEAAERWRDANGFGGS
jgi:hypothetical protein